jgi:regulator of RNase E activity RraA
MPDYTAFNTLSPTTVADALSGDRVMDMGIRPLWQLMPRIAGPAYPVGCAPGDNLMLHAAIYRAPPGAVIVVKAGDNDYAVSGGNVCAVARRRGIAGFVVDGVIRDLAEVREDAFPVFARGVSPIPGAKAAPGVLNGTVCCGGVEVSPGDMVVADEEGIVVVPVARLDTVLREASGRAARDAAVSLDEWEAGHHARIDAILRDMGMDVTDNVPNDPADPA